MRRALLVANPTAQSGRNAARIEVARAHLERAGVEHDFLSTEPSGGTVDAVARVLAEERHDVAIGMGGDGTFAEVAKGILQSGRQKHVRLGMLPTGTANDQGKSFGLSSDPSALEHNVAVVAAGIETSLDAARLDCLDVEGHIVRSDVFFDSAGWGIGPRVLAVRNEDRRAIESMPVVRDVWRDKLVYAGAMLRTFLASYVENDKFDVDLVLDGVEQRWERLSDLVVKGTRVYGGLWVLDPQSRHDDGKFEVVPFAGRRDWISKAMVHLDHSGRFAGALAKVGIRHSEGTSASRIDLTFHPRGGVPLAGQLDGEEFPVTERARIEVLPRVIRLIVPT
jgi:diacylglycerol kinase family enzyme